jgi:hypothetical protein
MGRAEPSHAPLTQQGYRKEQRAKYARTTINRTVPQLLASDARARRGVEQAYLFADTIVGSTAFDGRSTQGGSGLKTQKIGKNKRIEADKHMPEANELLQAAITSSPEDKQPVQISIHVADTLATARRLHQMSRSKRNVAILNMASPLRPGGGVLNGATSQEESLCVRSTLLPSLREEWYRLPEIGGIWSPDVLVFRVTGAGEDKELPKAERFYVDVVSSAMTRFPETTEKTVQEEDANGDGFDGRPPTSERVYASQKDRDLALQKMRTVLRLLESKKVERVVLGAWGCGAYGNPLGEICRAWKRALLGKRSQNSNKEVYSAECGYLKHVVFAVKDLRMAEEFAQYWGDDIQIESAAKRSDEPSNTDPGEEDLEELQQKIETLEVQLKNVKTPMLRQGLESTLQALKSELATTNEAASNEDEEND